MKEWTAHYTIAESPGFAIISGILARDEEEANELAAAEVGTMLTEWGYEFKLLDLRGVIETTKEKKS